MGTVTDWSERFGHINPFEKAERKGFNFEYKVAYRCRIAGAKIIQSTRGDKQIQLDLKVIDGMGEEADELGRTIEYFTLPKQDSDLELNEDLVKKIHRRRFLDVLRILSVGDPETYALYKEAHGSGKQKTFIGYDDKAMDDAAFKRREASTQADCQLWVDEAHESIGNDIPSLLGGEIYVEKVRNPKSDKYPWTNLYATVPTKLPIYSTSGDAPF